ncbi:MAG: hydroxyphenylacetyl-CoA thioesterase PaaI [Taibaiella sp.]|nr:hydroxyphenylacetyl-CoA thioesterase PaaI [Taibaiella sp.]
MSTPQDILQIMLAKDKFTEWLGIIIDEHKVGYCKLHFTVRDEMLNGFDIVHGGIVFAAADSAFAFACNGHGRLTVALDVSISFVKTATAGDQLFVEANEIHEGNKTGFYDVRVTNKAGEIIALFKGTAYRTDRMISPE